jgi:hypothetical protein
MQGRRPLWKKARSIRKKGRGFWPAAREKQDDSSAGTLRSNLLPSLRRTPQPPSITAAGQCFAEAANLGLYFSPKRSKKVGGFYLDPPHVTTL